MGEKKERSFSRDYLAGRKGKEGERGKRGRTRFFFDAMPLSMFPVEKKGEMEQTKKKGKKKKKKKQKKKKKTRKKREKKKKKKKKNTHFMASGRLLGGGMSPSSPDRRGLPLKKRGRCLTLMPLLSLRTRRRGKKEVSNSFSDSKGGKNGRDLFFCGFRSGHNQGKGKKGKVVGRTAIVAKEEKRKKVGHRHLRLNSLPEERKGKKREARSCGSKTQQKRGRKRKKKTEESKI